MKKILAKTSVYVAAILLFAGCTVMRGERSASQYVDDATITTNVKKALIQNDSVSATRVHVETDKGVVLLSGFVKNQAQAQTAEQSALSVAGVKSVKNNLTTYSEAHSKSIKNKIKRKLNNYKEN